MASMADFRRVLEGATDQDLAALRRLVPGVRIERRGEFRFTPYAVAMGAEAIIHVAQRARAARRSIASQVAWEEFDRKAKAVQSNIRLQEGEVALRAALRIAPADRREAILTAARRRGIVPDPGQTVRHIASLAQVPLGQLPAGQDAAGYSVGAYYEPSGQGLRRRAHVERDVSDEIDEPRRRNGDPVSLDRMFR